MESQNELIRTRFKNQSTNGGKGFDSCSAGPRVQSSKKFLMLVHR